MPALLPATQPDLAVLAGTVEQVTFHNAESGFCVLRIKARAHRDLVTVVGHAAATCDTYLRCWYERAIFEAQVLLS